MGGNKEGARKRRETLIKMLGSEALYLEHMRIIAKTGGMKGGDGRGFASEKVDEKGLTGKDRARLSRWNSTHSIITIHSECQFCKTVNGNHTPLCPHRIKKVE